MTVKYTFLAVTLVAGALACPRPVGAQEVDAATKSAARQLSYAGVEAFRKGDYPTALDKLERGWQLMRVPTLGLWSARAMVKLGKLVEASERYLEVTHIPLDDRAREALKEAKADASSELEALRPRIPHLRITLANAEPSEVEVSIDDKPVPAALIGAKRPVNPGKRKVVGKRGAQAVEIEVAVEEGQIAPARLEFSAVPAAAAPVAAPPLAAAPAPTAPLPTQPAEQDGAGPGTGQRTAGYIALGVGGVGLAVGGTAAVLALGKKSTLDDACVDRRCGPDDHGVVDDYNRFRTLSTVGFIVGAIGVGTGLTLLLTAPRDEPSAAGPTVRGYVGAASAGVVGSF